MTKREPHVVHEDEREPDITFYPDSDRVGLFAGAAPGGPVERRILKRFVRLDEVDYWDGEG